VPQKAPQDEALLLKQALSFPSTLPRFLRHATAVPIAALGSAYSRAEGAKRKLERGSVPRRFARVPERSCQRIVFVSLAVSGRAAYAACSLRRLSARSASLRATTNATDNIGRTRALLK